MILYPVPPSAKDLCICYFFSIVQDDMQSLYNKNKNYYLSQVLETFHIPKKHSAGTHLSKT